MCINIFFLFVFVFFAFLAGSIFVHFLYKNVVRKGKEKLNKLQEEQKRIKKHLAKFKIYVI